jgi:hypothetical protein
MDSSNVYYGDQQLNKSRGRAVIFSEKNKSVTFHFWSYIVKLLHGIT